MSRRHPSAPGPHGALSERSLVLRRRLLLGVWLLAAAGLLGRSVELQVAQGAQWRSQAERQHRMQGAVAAARGEIVDRDGIPLALSHETFRVGVAPHELSDPGAVATLLAVALDLSPAEAGRITADDRRWVSVPGRFPPMVREALRGVPGVYVERELRRFYPHGDLARGILGAVVDEEGAGGVEQAFEGHLQGVPGTETVARDSEGRAIPGETWLMIPPRSGGSVVLTLDAALQEIAHEALEAAVEANQARGGDLIVSDPRTGEILAMVSRRDGSTNHLGGITTPYEPGSTLKPFTVATLLRHERAGLADSVDTGNGRWTVNGREIQDVSVVGTVTLAQALQVSSNIGIAKAAQALSAEEQYEALRDFGFGVPTGIHLPGEAAGTLRRPSDWSRQSAASLAMGYEIAVTPIQMAMAYGALANGGVLMEPRLVKELRDAQGVVLERFEPRAVRRVVSDEAALEINRTLVGAVETGTGTQARLASFAVAGKSGTARVHGPGGYEAGAYYSSFAGFFPAEDPQLVVFVKLERPQAGAYYGGAIAAPVTRATLEAILAARKPPLDRDALAAIAQAQRGSQGLEPPIPAPAVLVAVRPAAPDALLSRMAAGSMAGTSEGTAGGFPSQDGTLLLPDLRGLPPRVAARRLHSMGLSVLWESAGTVGRTVPAAGTPVLPGESVRLLPAPPGAGPPSRIASRSDE